MHDRLCVYFQFGPLIAFVLIGLFRNSVDENRHMWCDCGKQIQELMPCRHVIAALSARAAAEGTDVDVTPYFGRRWSLRLEPFLGLSYQSGTYNVPHLVH